MFFTEFLFLEHFLVSPHQRASAARPPSRSAAPPLMNFHLLIADASVSTFAPVKTEIKMYLSLIKRIHVPRFALWVALVLRIACGRETLSDPRVGDQTAIGLTFDHPKDTFDQTAPLKSAFHPWMESSLLQNDLTPFVQRLITALMQVEEQRRSWTLIVQVVKCLCDLFCWAWMRKHRWKLPLRLFDAGGNSLKCYKLSCSSDGRNWKLLNVIWRSSVTEMKICGPSWVRYACIQSVYKSTEHK